MCVLSVCAFALGKCEIDAQLQFFKLKTVKCNKKQQKKSKETPGKPMETRRVAQESRGASRVASSFVAFKIAAAQQVNGKLDPHIMPQNCGCYTQL